MMNFDELARQYNEALKMRDKNAAHHRIDLVLNEAACNLPKDNPDSLEWFSVGLSDPEKKWFIAKLMAKVNPVPKALLDELVLAAMLEPNPSANKFYVLPCVKTFGAAKVRERMDRYSSRPEVIAVNGYDQTSYWVRG
ncbi:MAG: hypothetical protein JKY04_01015 [Sneathiella sp.]|nr:hypothetical protein [Sneathiella sp.]